MEQVKNLDDKRVCDKSKDGKVIVIEEGLHYPDYRQCRQNAQGYP